MVLVEELPEESEMESEDESPLESDDESGPELDPDSDSQLQEAFEKGILKPGTTLKDPEISRPPRVFTNNTKGLKRKLEAFKLSVTWVERLDVVSGLAPLAPELAEKMQEAAAKGAAGTDDTALAANDFQRELSFYRQAQATVLEALPRLHSLGIPTRRPDDYFAQMIKTDEHMQKVRASLSQKQTEEARREKIRQFRHQKKFGKKVEAEAKVAKQMQKKAMLDEVRKFRKGQRKDLDFLDDDKPSNKPEAKTHNSGQSKIKRSQFRRDARDKKFGHGGRKRGLKANTSESSADMSGGGNRPSRGGGGGARGKMGGGGGARGKTGGGKGKVGGKGKTGGKQQRPGKGRRQGMKGRK